MAFGKVLQQIDLKFAGPTWRYQRQGWLVEQRVRFPVQQDELYSDKNMKKCVYYEEKIMEESYFHPEVNHHIGSGP